MTILLTRPATRTWTVALRLLLLTVLAVIGYTAAVSLVGQLALNRQANGSLVVVNGRTVGSALIGQSFADSRGNPLPQWFQSRPSAAGDGYDGAASSGSNLGPNNPDLVKTLTQRRAAYTRLNGPGSVPVDAITASGSGLDPHISVANALRQAGRVAATRGISAGQVRDLVQRTMQAPDLGYLGQPTVNVLTLNRALAAADPAGNSR